MAQGLLHLEATTRNEAGLSPGVAENEVQTPADPAPDDAKVEVDAEANPADARTSSSHGESPAPGSVLYTVFLRLEWSACVADANKRDHRAKPAVWHSPYVLAREDVLMLDPIGAGGHGLVHRAKWKAS